MKFITDKGKVGVLRGDKQEAEKCHNASLHISKEQLPKLKKPDGAKGCLLVDLEPPEKKVHERPKPEGDLQQVHVGQHSEQVTDATNSFVTIRQVNRIKRVSDTLFLSFGVVPTPRRGLPGYDSGRLGADSGSLGVKLFCCNFPRVVLGSNQLSTIDAYIPNRSPRRKLSNAIGIR
ncbi:hypothetical protein PIB30_077321 [Stylosanthes scabra]|uniref:Uncharacterized protein n=1 Tax=Stylosanthes scabra TaxID=79078 RepID=A0ABU6SSE3_9FABA|nr:hypothetical protein [Stylosanthes scabra]